MVQMDMEESFQLGSGDESSSSETEAPTAQKRKLQSSAEPGEKRQKTFKQPTADELNHLRETQNLFNSNIFRLQIEELLSEVKIKPKHEKNYKVWFEDFRKTFEEIEEFENVTLKRGVGEKKIRKFVGEMLDGLEEESPFWRKNDGEIAMSFPRPKNIENSGNLTCIRTKIKFSPSILITIPKSVFYEKDYLNGKYLLKKSSYLFFLKKHLQKQTTLIKTIESATHLNNPLLPTLILTPNFSSDVRITLFLQPEVATFKPTRFTPDKNNIKKDSTNLNNHIPLDAFATVGTPYYNTALLFDITLGENQGRIKDVLEGLGNVQDGIKLVFVWLSQRKLDGDFRGFSQEIAIYFMLHLIAKKKISKHMSSYQVVRIFWANLAQVSGPIALAENANFEQFANSRFVLLDWSGVYNVAQFLDAEIFATVKNEAKIALDGLDDVKFNTFSALFTQKISTAVQFDTIIKINDEKGLKKIYKNAADAEKFKYLFYDELLLSNVIVSNLRQGLTDRVTRIVPIFGPSLRFGLNFDPDTYANVITKGPKQFEPEAEAFKKFWGKLAELRRFKDTSICEAVYFEAKTTGEKRQIVRRIVDHVMGVKLQLGCEVNGVELEALLGAGDAPGGEEAALRAKSAHTELGKILRELKLPLSITALQCVSDVYSYTDPFPPLQTSARWSKKFTSPVHEDVTILDANVKTLTEFVQPIECIIQLALHSKWPRSLEAFRAMKTMFLAEMSNLLRSGPRIKSVLGDDSLDVYYAGFAFRLFLYHPKELALLKQDVTSDGITCYKDTVDSLRLERKYDVLPKIVGALNGVQQMYPSFGPSTCLVKRWLRSQLLDGAHISDTVVNLLNASLFLAPEPHKVATLPQVAFLRFLRFFAEFDAKTQPIVVNFNNDIPKDVLSEMETKFLQNRQNFANLHILTPHDDGNSVFTKQNPTPDILQRLKVLAAATFTHLSNSVNAHGPLKHKGLFVPNVEGYDVAIHLKAALNPRGYQQVVKDDSVKFDVYPYAEDFDGIVPVIGFDPVAIYLNELRETYGDLALFFHDSYGGDKIWVLWSKKALEILDFKISNVGGRRVSMGKLAVNCESLVEDFRLLGDGLVQKIVQL